MTRKMKTLLTVSRAGFIIALCVATQIAHGQTNRLPHQRNYIGGHFPLVVRGQDPAAEAGYDEAQVSPAAHEQSFQLVSGGEKGCDDCGKSPCCCPLPSCYCCPQTTGVYAEWLYMHTTGIDVPYGIVEDGIGAPGTSPMGEVGVADHTWDHGVRAGLRKCLSDCAALHFSYTWFESNTEDLINSPGTFVINPLFVTVPVPNAGDFAQRAAAMYDVSFQTADIDYRYRWNCGAIGHVDVVLGGRYANLEQDFDVRYNFATPDGYTDVTSKIDFDGGGLRIGLDGERYLHGCSKIKVYGKGFASVMSGSFKSQYSQVNQFGGEVARVRWEDDRFVPILEGEIGLVLEHCHWRVAVGYQMAAWFNAVTTPVFAQAVQTGNYTNVQDTITFDGIVARLEYLW